VALAAGAVQTAAAFSRSLIPYGIDGTLHEVATVGDTDGRLVELRIGGRGYEVDDGRLAELRVGRHLTKDAWATTLLADGRKPYRLPVGWETFRFASLTVVAVAAVWLLSGSRRPQGAGSTAAADHGEASSGNGAGP
jgi:hypothetical protein